MYSVGAISGVQQNLKLFLSLDQHYTQNLATRILSLILSFSLVGRLLMGWLADRFPTKHRDGNDLYTGGSSHSFLTV
jgi:MFS family permease